MVETDTTLSRVCRWRGTTISGTNHVMAENSTRRLLALGPTPLGTNLDPVEALHSFKIGGTRSCEARIREDYLMVSQICKIVPYTDSHFLRDCGIAYS